MTQFKLTDTSMISDGPQDAKKNMKMVRKYFRVDVDGVELQAQQPDSKLEPRLHFLALLALWNCAKVTARKRTVL